MRCSVSRGHVVFVLCHYQFSCQIIQSSVEVVAARLSNESALRDFIRRHLTRPPRRRVLAQITCSELTVESVDYQLG